MKVLGSFYFEAVKCSHTESWQSRTLNCNSFNVFLTCSAPPLRLKLLNRSLIKLNDRNQWLCEPKQRREGIECLWSVKLMRLLITEAYQLIYSVNVSTWVLLIGWNFSQSLEFEEGKESIVGSCDLSSFVKLCRLSFQALKLNSNNKFKIISNPSHQLILHPKPNDV